MKIRTEFMPRDGGADIHLATDGTDPIWMVLRWNQADNRLSGYLGQPVRDGIANVRPVDMVSPEIQENSVGAMAVWMMVSAGKLEAREKGAVRKKSQADQLSIWEDFLSSNEKPKDTKIVDDGVTVELTVEQVIWMTGRGLINSREGVLTPKRNPNLNTGVLISGFDALKVQTAISKTFQDIKVPVIAHLDQAKEALRSISRPSSRAVQWYGTAEGENARDRMQAAKSFPLMAGVVADNPNLARVVDDREPLQPLIMERTGLGKGALKRVSQITDPLPTGKLFESRDEVRGEDALGVNRLRRFTVSGEVSLDTLMRHLSALPPDRVPQDNHSFKIFHDILAGCAIPIQNGLSIPVEKTLSACKGDWVAFHAALAKAADFEPERFDRRAIALTTIDAMEAIEDFSRSAVMPLALSAIQSTGEIIPEVSNEFFTAGLGVGSRIFLGDAKNVTASLFEMARRYSSRIPALMDASGYTENSQINAESRFAAYGTTSFPRLMNDYRASNGLVIRQLDTHDLLKRESTRLGHCVGRMYLDKAYKANCHIFSVQPADGSQSLSTIELSGTNGTSLEQVIKAYTLVQHRARNNAAPDHACNIASAEWLKDVKSGRVNLNWSEVVSWKDFLRDGREVAQTPTVSWTGVLGTDWMDNDSRQAVWEEWRYIAGGSFGKSPSPDVIFRDKGARDLVGKMNPKAASILLERAKQPKTSVDHEENTPAP